MVGKKSGRALLREEGDGEAPLFGGGTHVRRKLTLGNPRAGLERTDNNMDLSSWPQVAAINQKNYYTDYLKRDDQILAYRLQNEEARAHMLRKARERERAQAMKNEVPLPDPTPDPDGDTTMLGAADGEAAGEPEVKGAKTVVMHLGSQNFRIGFASDALPKSMPMVIAHRASENEAEAHAGEARPRRRLVRQASNGSGDEGGGEGTGRGVRPDELFGEDFASAYASLQAALKAQMRQNKRRTLPNSREMVINHNRRTIPETVSEHNDPLRIEYTDVNVRGAPEHIIGEEALRIPDYSTPRYRLFWPIRNGWPNERDYPSKAVLFHDIGLIIEHALKTQLGFARRRDWSTYSAVFVIPDLYEKAFATEILDMLIREFGFARVCFVQESLAGSFGAGFSTACVVDIGAQKTSVCCVDEGMCVENSRVNVIMGGADVTEMFVKMMLFDYFPYAEINLNRRYDWLLAEDLKKKHCTFNEANVSVQLCEFHLRAHGQDTRKYTFKTYDEVYLAPLCLLHPHVFDNAAKLEGRRRLIPRSVDIYDNQPNDPVSAAQVEILTAAAPTASETGDGAAAAANTQQQRTPTKAGQPYLLLNRRHELDATPRSSRAGTPAASVSGLGLDRMTGSPQPTGTMTPSLDGGAAAAAGGGAGVPATSVKGGPPRARINDRDDILPLCPLDTAILTSIFNAAKPEDRKLNDFLGGILVIGGGSLVPNLHSFLEERLQAVRPAYASAIMVGTPPRELDPQVVVWKGASVFGKLEPANDSWISRLEYDRLGSRVLVYKCMWAW
ncbi:actin-like protein arp8 [Ascosphaera acerosa]|nr:actin-like protein arp8 [Ascosphaera acerosa]